MEGRILGVDTNGNVCTIKADDGNKYTFSNEDWKGETEPKVGQVVDFTIEEGNKAIEVFSSFVESVEKDNTAKAIVALLLTIFLGFIGTAIVRFGLLDEKKKEEYGTVVPTSIHLVCDLLIIIPIIGWIVALGANIYFAIQNYKACQ